MRTNLAFSPPLIPPLAGGKKRRSRFQRGAFPIVFALIFNALSAHASSLDLCRFVTAHQLAPDVAFRPGVDVHGNPVAPADIGPALTALPDVIRVPVTIDLVERLKLSLPAGTILEAPVALVDIHSDGRVLYNGRDISGDVAALCAIETEDDEPQEEQ